MTDDTARADDIVQRMTRSQTVRRDTPARPPGLLREAAEEAHLFGPDHDRRPFDECRYEPCVKRRAALAADEAAPEGSE